MKLAAIIALSLAACVTQDEAPFVEITNTKCVLRDANIDIDVDLTASLDADDFVLADFSDGPFTEPGGSPYGVYYECGEWDGWAQVPNTVELTACRRAIGESSIANVRVSARRTLADPTVDSASIELSVDGEHIEHEGNTEVFSGPAATQATLNCTR